jgi:hypothetical protein|tara:strand:- start:3181 stop:3348 length:168 start_codon:yes stop_codon:yes gene_type:complete
MAKINEDVVVIKISELLKDSDESRKLVGPEVVTSLQEVIKELVGGNVLIEIENAE